MRDDVYVNIVCRLTVFERIKGRILGVKPSVQCVKLQVLVSQSEDEEKRKMKSYSFGVLFLLCLAVVFLPENTEAYSAGTGRFGDETKV